MTGFVGRGRELRRIEELFGRGRLVTAVGPGGVGKTRVAVEAACSVWPAGCGAPTTAPIRRYEH